ncbi:hypothetical protein [Streptomyces sp. NPDC046870]|uniref:hypothetical protein n=1 Tax=Streptomyces sp. NPDC046870 TaxID=3155135 RepID=UPI0034514E9B
MTRRSGMEVVGVAETRLTRDLHRRATTLLSQAAPRPSVRLDAFPALSEHVSPESWAALSQEVIATSMEAACLAEGFFDVGTPEEVSQVLARLSESAQFVPMIREQAQAALTVLSGTVGS